MRHPHGDGKGPPDHGTCYMATARAHPTPPYLPRHYYTRGSSPVTLPYEGVGLHRPFVKTLATRTTFVARAQRTMAPVAWRPQGPGRFIAPPTWRPQGPTHPHPASLATTIHEGRPHVTFAYEGVGLHRPFVKTLATRTTFVVE